MDSSSRYDDELIVSSATSSPANRTRDVHNQTYQQHLQPFEQTKANHASSRVPRELAAAHETAVDRGKLSVVISNDSPENRLRLISVSQPRDDQSEQLLTVRSEIENVESTTSYQDTCEQLTDASRLSVAPSSRWVDRPNTPLVLSSDERQRGEAIEFNQLGASDITTDVEKGTPEKPVEPPKGLVASIIGGTIATLLFTVVYLPFTLAILTQSFVQRRGILPINHEKELTIGYWKFSFTMFLVMFSLPFLLIYGVLTDQGIWSIYNNNMHSAVPFTMLFALYLALLAILHFMTVFYAHLRADLRSLKRMDLPFTFSSTSHLLCTVSIIFETLQLNAPYLTASQLGLAYPVTQWDGLLNVTYSTFRVGQWEIVDFTTLIPAFWIAFGVIFAYALFLGYGIQSDMQPDHKLGPILFDVVPGTLYFTLVGRLLEMFNCDPASDGSGNYYLRNAVNVACWDNSNHKSMLMAALMALLFYSSSANFVACYRGDAGSKDNKTVRFKPLYLVTERTLRDLFAITTALISDRQLSRSLGLVITFALLCATIYIKPCSVPTLGRLKVLSQLTVTLTLFMSFLPAIFRSQTRWFDDNDPALIVFGWCVMLVGYLIFELYEYRRLSKQSNKIVAIESQEIVMSPLHLPQPRTGSVFMGGTARRASEAINSAIRDAGENISQVRRSTIVGARRSMAQLTARSQNG